MYGKISGLGNFSNIQKSTTQFSGFLASVFQIIQPFLVKTTGIQKMSIDVFGIKSEMNSPAANCEVSGK